MLDPQRCTPGATYSSSYLFELLPIRAPTQAPRGLEKPQRILGSGISTLAKGNDCCGDVVGLRRITSVLTDTLENS